MNASSANLSTLMNRAIELSMPDRDELLQSSRRVDWRFLLPQPDLAATAYFGAVDMDLIESLRRFCSSLTMPDDPSANSTTTEQFPVVVASNPNQQELARAAQAVRGGGFVYIEINRRVRASGPLRRVNGCLSAMSNLHLVDLQVHWHWPNFESCTEIIPLHDRAAGACALHRHGSGTRSRWKSKLATLLLETRLLASFVPCFSVLGHRLQQEDSRKKNQPLRGLGP